MRFKIIYFLLALSLFAQHEMESFSRLSKTNAYLVLPEAYKDFIDGDIKTALSRIGSLEKNHINLYNTAFLAYYDNNMDLALSAVNKSILEEEDFAWAYFLKAMILFKQGSVQESLVSINRAIDEEDVARFYFLKGQILEALMKKTEAIEAYGDAATENPDRVDFQLKYLRSIYNGRNLEDILSELINIEEDYYPQDDFYIFLGDLYLRKKNAKKAIESYKNYLRYYPNGSHKDLALQKLQSLKANQDTSVTENEETKYRIRLGEELKYKVSYGFNLGNMKIKVDTKSVDINGREHARINYHLESTSFLLSLNAIYEAFLDMETKETTYSFLSQVSDDEIQEIKVYIFNKTNNKFTARIVNKGGRFDLVSFELPVHTQDGTAILYYARELVSKQKSQIVSTVIDESLKRTDIFLKSIKTEESALGKEDNYHYLSAQAHYQGVAGMTGFAEGWFSIDGEFVPLVGKLRILVGSVRVELVEKK